MSKQKFSAVAENEPQSEATGTEVAVAQPTAVSTDVQARGLQVRFATLMPFYTVCALPDDVVRECKEGDFVLKLSKTSAFRLSGSGRNNKVRAIVVDGKRGFLEGCPLGEGGTQAVPRAWVVGRPKAPDSTEVLKTLEECRAAAQAEAPDVRFYRFEDYSKAMNPIPKHYIAECFYLELLVQVPETAPADVLLIKVGDTLYTPARVLFKKFDPIKVRQFFNNIQTRESMKHRGDKSWTWSPYGQFISIFTEGQPFTRPNGSKGAIWTPRVEAALDDKGSLYVPNDEEVQDLQGFYNAATNSPVTEAELAEAGSGDL